MSKAVSISLDVKVLRANFCNIIEEGQYGGLLIVMEDLALIKSLLNF